MINVALCSFGMSGLVFHAPFISLHPGFHFYAVWERSQKKAAGKYPGVLSFDDYDVMLQDDNIQLVVVNTPNDTHYEYAKKALNAGRHVLVEKAFTVTQGEAEELVALANYKSLKIAVFQNRRYDSDFRTVKKIVDEGRLGKIIEAAFHYDRYNLALSPKLHKETLTAGSGLLHDLGPHVIDQALYLFGMPASVFGYTRITRPGSLVNDFFDITLFYAELTVRLKGSLTVKEPQPSYILHGLQGSFLKSRADVQEDSLKAGAVPISADWGIEPVSAQGILNHISAGVNQRCFVTTEKGNYMAFYDALYEALENGAPIPVPGTDGINTMKIIEAVLQSNASGKVVVLSA